jgi:hypothetical protein
MMKRLRVWLDFRVLSRLADWAAYHVPKTPLADWFSSIGLWIGDVDGFYSKRIAQLRQEGH